jgi:hypothetical protein
MSGCFKIFIYDVDSRQSVKRGQLLTKKFMLQGYDKSTLKPSFRKIYGRYNIVCDYKLSLDHMLNDLFYTFC